MATLTTANSALALQIVNLFNSPQLIQGYATDDSFAADDMTDVETAMGVDGFFSAGYTPKEVPLNIMLQADSPSNDIFDQWAQAQIAAREVYVANATIWLPGVAKKYAFTRGFLTSRSPMPGSKKILQPRKFVVTFQSVSPANA